jgi:hypothetical protein
MYVYMCIYIYIYIPAAPPVEDDAAYEAAVVYASSAHKLDILVPKVRYFSTITAGAAYRKLRA